MTPFLAFTNMALMWPLAQIFSGVEYVELSGAASCLEATESGFTLKKSALKPRGNGV
jgi:hypothetical protein